RNPPGGDSSSGHADARSACSVSVRVELHAEPRRVSAHSFADRSRVFANAPGEHNRVESAKRGEKRAKLATNAIAVEVNRQLRPRIARGQERAHVAGDARHA